MARCVLGDKEKASTGQVVGLAAVATMRAYFRACIVFVLPRDSMPVFVVLLDVFRCSAVCCCSCILSCFVFLHDADDFMKVQT